MQVHWTWLVVLCWSWCTPAQAETVTVFAAASAGETTKAIVADWMRTHHDIEVVCSVASTAVLARQILAGAPADVFLAADEAWMDQVAADRTFVDGQRRDLLANRLVMIVPAESPLQRIEVSAETNVAALISGRVAMAQPENVPAGRYAREACEHLGWWAALSPRVAPCQDVSAALRLVAIGEADVGFVYASDLRPDQTVAESRVRQVAIIPENVHTPIRYPIAWLNDRPAVRAVAAAFAAPSARERWEAAGFTMVAVP